MIKETADKDPLVFIFKIHIPSLKLLMFPLPYNGNNYYIRMNL